MARQNADSRKNGRPQPIATRNGFDQFEFVDMRLETSEKAEFKAYLATSGNELWDDLYTLVQAGYKLSVSYMPESDCFIASLTCKSNGDVNENRVLTSRSDDFVEAVMLNVYKTTVVCKDRAWPTTKTANNWG